MPVRVRYKRTELSEGVVETLENVDKFAVLDDNTVELRKIKENGKYRIVGYIHPTQWESVLLLDYAEE